MSLTSKEWEEMWEEIKVLERFFSLYKRKTNAHMYCLSKIKSIKNKIEQVIGQME